jgi:hypothetical protein
MEVTLASTYRGQLSITDCLEGQQLSLVLVDNPLPC